MGDFNFHYDCPSSTCMSKILDCISIFNLVQPISTPTHKCGHILDWILHRSNDTFVRSTSVTNELSSDHLCVICHLDLSIPNSAYVPINKRNLISINRDNFSHDISTYIATQTSLSAEHLNEFLCSLIDIHAPKTQTRAPLQKCDPWYSEIRDQLRSAKRKHRKAERRWISSGLTVHKQIYDATKTQVTSLVHAAKTTYFSTKISESTTCKQLFGITNKLLSRSKSSPIPTAMPLEKLPDLFSQFFLDKVENIRDQFDSNTPVNSPSPFNYDTVFHGTTLTSFKPITADSLWSLLKKSSPKSCALDPIPTPLLFECLDAVMPVLTNIVNTSLTTGIYPSIYKTAIVKPLLKKPTLDPNELKNYRPVSNLSFMSKVLEKVVLAQVFSHLNSHNLISEFQSAYRPGHSTETALLKVANDLLTAMDTGKVSVLTLLDLSAAFDTVDHDILLHRLEHTFGFQGTALAWVRSYLSGRTQTVSIDGRLSSPTVIRYGVPQGSVLWPILFILYTQPLPCVIVIIQYHTSCMLMIPKYTVLVVHQRSMLPSTTWRNAYVMSNPG